MIRTFALAGILAVSATSLSTAAFAENPLPGVDLATQIINDVTAPLQPILASDAAPAPAAAPAKTEHHAKAHGAKHHAKAHGAKHHAASRKSKHKTA